MTDILLGIVSKIEDPDKFIIRFTVDGWIEDCIAYPIDTFDQPEVGDPIVLFGLESILGYSYMWKKQRHFDFTRLKLGDSTIEIKSKEINIISGKSSIKLDSTGKITLIGNSEAPPMTMGDGRGLVNISDLEALVQALLNDLAIVPSGANLSAWIASNQIKWENKNIIHK